MQAIIKDILPHPQPQRYNTNIGMQIKPGAEEKKMQNYIILLPILVILILFIWSVIKQGFQWKLALGCIVFTLLLNAGQLTSGNLPVGIVRLLSAAVVQAMMLYFIAEMAFRLSRKRKENRNNQ
jgi:hypothetical protein